MSEFAGYVRDVKTGNILGIQAKSSLIEIEKENIRLTKKHDEHLIRFEILSQSEVDEHLSNPTKKAGRPKTK